jgi:hypothetical protein
MVRHGLLGRTLGAVLCAAALAVTAGPARAALDPAVVGQWDPPRQWPAVAVHLVLMHSGKAIFWRGDESTPKVYVWDPKTELITTTLPGSDIFCAGHSALPDGRIFVSGGDTNRTNIFDPVTETWTRGPDMRQRRFYPSHVTLGDGRILIFSGRASSLVEIVESYTPGASQIDLLAGANRKMEFYPRLFPLPSGLTVYVGEEPTSAVLDPATGAWRVLGNSKFGNRYEGTAVVLPPGHDKIMIAGGEGGTNTAEILDMAAPSPAWRNTTPMNYAHTHVQSVILPTGKILIAGGSTLNLEEFDPATETWTVLAPLATKREYHSTAVLLPDARVVWAGTNGNRSREIFSPPYLFRGSRPVIASAPAYVHYGDTFRVTTPQAGSIASAVFMRPGASTHAWNMDQRYVELAFSQTASDTLELEAPTVPNVAPPGYYMLFLLDAAGVPSVAPFVQLGGATGATTTSSTTTTTRPSTSPSTTTSSTVAPTTTVPPTTTTTTLPSGIRTVEVRAAASSDDAEESSAGVVDLTSSDLELVHDVTDQTVGIRFPGLNVPQGATIVRAWVQFTVDEKNTEATTVRIQGETAVSALPFTTTTRNISQRLRTRAAATWGPIPAWSTTDIATADQRTGDVAAIIKEIVDIGGWRAGNAVALIFTGSGHRTADSYDGSKTKAPLLHVEYDTAPTPTTSTTTAPSTTTTTTSSTPSTLAPSTTTTSPTTSTLAPSTSTTTVPASASTTTTLPAVIRTVEVRVAASADDAEENPSGTVDLTSSDLELVNDGADQTIGMRFAGVAVPPSATIVRAWVQFTVDEKQSEATTVVIAGESADSALPFAQTLRNVSQRPRTLATSTWGPIPPWATTNVAGAEQRTVDIGAVIREIVARGNWRAGNALVLIVTGSGHRTADSYDGSNTQAPLLHVEYGA